MRFNRLRLVQNDDGTIAPLVAGYLALLVMVGLLASNVVAAMSFANRLQGLTDLAVIYAHERALRIGIPQQGLFQTELARFLTQAPSAKRIALHSTRVSIQGPVSTLELCARFSFPLSPGGAVICKQARAQSFLL
jgi:hypothetical protein